LDESRSPGHGIVGDGLRSHGGLNIDIVLIGRTTDERVQNKRGRDNEASSHSKVEPEGELQLPRCPRFNCAVQTTGHDAENRRRPQSGSGIAWVRFRILNASVRNASDLLSVIRFCFSRAKST
jgi:hypothetical protein